MFKLSLPLSARFKTAHLSANVLCRKDIRKKSNKINVNEKLTDTYSYGFVSSHQLP
jgi:hypothetical protein